MFAKLLLVLIVSTLNVALAKAPSSEIPTRREFPVSEELSPCHNFHDYVCSKVEASFKLRQDRSRHTFAFSDSSERLLLEKRKFFKNIQKEKNLGERGEALKANFLACMNQKEGAKEEKNWVSHFKKELDALSTVETFRAYQIDNVQQGRPSLFEISETENVSDPLIYDLYVGIKFMNLPDHSYYDNPELMKAYRQLMIEFFKTAAKSTQIEAEKKSDAVIQLEKDFIKIYPQPEVRRQRWTEKREVVKTDFVKTYPSVGMEGFFKLFPEKVFVRLLIPEAMKFYNDHLVPESLQTLKDYFFFVSASEVMDDAYSDYFQKEFAFKYKFLGGPEKRPVLDERCTMDVMDTYTKELDEILLSRLFPDFPEEKFKALAEKIRRAIVQGIEQNQWLSAEARKEAIQKMTTARLQLIKPQNEREWDFHPVVKYSPIHQIQNREMLESAEFKKLLNIIGAPVNSDRWYMGPLTVNAYYDPSSNKFVMPLGILQYPFFDVKGSDIENLGSVGAVIGHELGHGIDDMGARFDHKGRLHQWMTMKDLAQFSQRSSQLIDQYSKIGHNGKLTLGENVADLVGVTFAYNAAFPKNEGSVEDKKKFFISYGRLWCSVVRPQYAEKQLKTDPHSLGWARINEPLKHQRGFVEAFQCKEGDKMYLPESQRVRIW